MFDKKKPNEKSFLFGMVKTIDDQARTIDIVASTSERDRHGDIVKPDAFSETLGSFLANSVILACHQHRLSDGSSPVIGSAIPESVKIGKNNLTMTIRFAGTDLGEQYWSLYRDGHMKAFSIGFMPLEWTDEKDESLGWIRTYTKIELLEVSAVPVPSNRSALARVKELFENDKNTGDVVKLFETLEKAITDAVTEAIENRFCEQKDWLDEQFEQIKDIIIPDSDDYAARLLLPESSGDAVGPDGDDEMILGHIERIQKSLSIGDT